MSGAGKPSETRFCLFPEICDRSKQCESWLRTHEGCHDLRIRMRLAHKTELALFAVDERIFLGGEHETGNCTACARLVVQKFGGEIRGYEHAKNPTAAVGEVEYGHDFAIAEGGYLVDPWLFHYYGDAPVLDFENDLDRSEILRRYGPEEKWLYLKIKPWVKIEAS